MRLKKENREYRSRKKDIRAIPEKISRVMDLPIETFHNVSRVEIMGNQEMMMEGIQKISEYDENMILLEGKKHKIKVFGSQLFVQCFSEENAVITGKIQSVEFIVK